MSNKITKPTNMRKRNAVVGFYGGFGRNKDITKRGEGIIVAYEGLNHNLGNSSSYCQGFNNIRGKR